MLINSVNQITKEMLDKKVIAFPTDTVYGIGAKIDDLDAINKIYEIKKRDVNKPLAILCAKIDDLMPYIKKPSAKILTIMEKYWPGALTIIFNKSALVNNLVTMNLPTIAFRIPNEPTALELLTKVGPLATTSVNLSGEKPLNDYNQINHFFGDQIDYIITKNVPSSNIASTIIDATTDEIKIIRLGEIKNFS